MPELGSELSNDRKEILKRVKQNRKYEMSGLLITIAAIIPSVYLAVPIFLEFVESGIKLGDIFSLQFIITSLSGYVPILVGASLSFTLLHFRPYKLTTEDFLFLKVCSALDDLGAYIENGREPDRKRAEKKVDKIFGEIQDWDFGNLKLCENVLGSQFKLFQEAFHRKLLGAARQREKGNLLVAYRILKTFAKFLLKPKPEIECLNSITEAMNKRISLTIPEAIGSQRKILRHFKEASLFRHILVVTGSIITGLTIGYVGYSIGIQIEYAYTMTITVALGLILAYFEYVARK